MSSTADLVVKKILSEMDSRGWNRSDLSRVTGVHRVLISKYLNDDPAKRNEVGFDNLDRISAAFGMSTLELLGVREGPSAFDAISKMSKIPADILEMLPHVKNWDLLRRTLKTLTQEKGQAKAQSS